jgi:hypothetical protein
MKEQNSNNIHVFTDNVKMSKYLPIEIKPSYSLDYTMNGDLNQNFRTYRDLYEDSPTNNSIINAFTNYIYGAGLNLRDGNIKQYLDDDDTKLAIQDLKIHGGFSMLVYWVNGKPLRLSYIDIEKIAIVLERGTFNHKSYKFCLDWKDRYRYKIIDYPKFTGKDNGNKIELLYVKNLSKYIFPVPDWVSGIQWAKVEGELSNSAVNFLYNSINQLTVVNVNSGNIDPETLEAEADKMRKRVAGTSNNGAVVVAYQQGAEYATTVDRIAPPDLNQQNVFFTEEAERCIIKAHSSPPILFSGSQTSTGFSNNAEERTQALQDAYRRNINPFREVFINGVLPVFKLINPVSVLEFEDFDKVEEIETEIPVLDDTTLNAQAQLKGSVGGVQSLLEVQASYVAGTTSYESAIAILDLIFGFNREQAVRLLGNPQVTPQV